MIIQRAKRHGGTRCWYDRTRKCNSRVYHVFGLSRIVMKEGSAWRLVLGSWTIAFGLRGHR